jgi:hypothetical protein
MLACRFVGAGGIPSRLVRVTRMCLARVARTVSGIPLTWFSHDHLTRTSTAAVAHLAPREQGGSHRRRIVGRARHHRQRRATTPYGARARWYGCQGRDAIHRSNSSALRLRGTSYFRAIILGLPNCLLGRCSRNRGPKHCGNGLRAWVRLWGGRLEPDLPGLRIGPNASGRCPASCES